MLLHDTAGINCKNDITTKINAQVSSIWDMEYVFEDCVGVCVLSDLT